MLDWHESETESDIILEALPDHPFNPILTVSKEIDSGPKGMILVDVRYYISGLDEDAKILYSILIPPWSPQAAANMEEAKLLAEVLYYHWESKN